MKITAVKTFVLRHQLKHASGPGNHFYRERQALLIKLETDAGVNGWGETAAFGGVRNLIEQQFAPTLIGRDPVAFRAIWQDLWGRNFGNGMAVGGVSIALEDLRGKALGLPLAELYGGRLREQVECYCSAMGYLEGVDPEEQYPRDALAAAAAGFRAYKFRIGAYSVRKDAAAMARVRAEVGPEFKLMADGNGCYTIGTAIQMGRELERLGFYWFEEPLPQNTPDYAAYEVLREKLDIPIAACEGITARGGFKEAIVRRATDIIQPDPALAGGFAECLFVAELARLYGIPCMPHCWAGGLNTAACVHLVSLLPALSSSLDSEMPMAEIGTDENPFLHDIMVEPLEFRDGRMTVPRRAGLGVEVDERKLKPYLV
jgi:D-galactarolactone cycloisomerase